MQVNCCNWQSTFDIVQLTIYFVALSHYLVEGDDFYLLRQEVTFNQGATTGNIQRVSIRIIDDSLVEGTERFVISGNVTTPASFVPGGDTVTVNILDNDGEWTMLLFHICMVVKNINVIVLAWLIPERRKIKW